MHFDERRPHLPLSIHTHYASCSALLLAQPGWALDALRSNALQDDDLSFEETKCQGEIVTVSAIRHYLWRIRMQPTRSGAQPRRVP
jgi:hypothetical protein